MLDISLPHPLRPSQPFYIIHLFGLVPAAASQSSRHPDPADWSWKATTPKGKVISSHGVKGWVCGWVPKLERNGDKRILGPKNQLQASSNKWIYVLGYRHGHVSIGILWILLRSAFKTGKRLAVYHSSPVNAQAVKISPLLFSQLEDLFLRRRLCFYML